MVMKEWCWGGDRVCLLREGSIDEGLGVWQDGKTPLELAVEKGYDATAALLREVRGA